MSIEATLSPQDSSERFDEPAPSDAMAKEMLKPGEVSLALRPAYYAEIRETPVLEREEELRLAKQFQAGDTEAYGTFLKANQRLVVFIAAKKLHKALNLSLDDLAQEGNLSLIDAMGDFDPKKGYRFSTYAYKRIAGGIERAIDEQDRTIRIPVNHEEKLGSLSHTGRKLEKKYKRQPTDEEIAGYLGMTESELAELQAIARAPVPLDAPYARGEGRDATTVGDVVADVQAINPEQEVFAMFGHDEDETDDRLSQQTNTIRQAILEVLADLPEREQVIVKQVNGIEGVPALVFAEIGAELGISADWAFRLHKRALEKLIPAVRLKLVEQGLVSVSQVEEVFA